MGLPTSKHVDARNCDGSNCRYDRGKAPSRLRKGRDRWIVTRLISFAIAAWAATSPLHSDTIRVATYNVELERAGPGLLLRDILKGEDPQIAAVSQVITHIAPDVLVLQKVDYDHDLLALTALRDVIAEAGLTYPHIFALRPNTGMPTGQDMDGDGRKGRARDAQSHGEFSGQGGMAILSRHSIDVGAVADFSTLLWKEYPNALLPMQDGAVFPSAEAIEVQRLSSVGHWAVPVKINGNTLNLFAFHASTPVFDGPEDRNGKRNHDELLFWRHYLDGAFGSAPDRAFMLIGDANLDPVDSDGRKEAIQSLLNDTRLQDPRPMRAPAAQGMPGNYVDRMDTVSWPAPGPGELRVDYILPSIDIRVVASGVFWPPEGTPDGQIVQRASRHRMVWVDIELGAY